MGTGVKNIYHIDFGCVIYPSALEYFDVFVKSVSEQTEKAFDLLVMNDGAEVSVLEEKLHPLDGKYHIISVEDGLSPADIRVCLIAEAKKRGTDILIIGDTDDTFSSDRVERIVEVFCDNPQADFVYNGLRTFDNKRAMPDLPESIENVKAVAHYNFLGMSNTAIRINALDEGFIRSLGECDSFVFDWYLYSRLLLDKHKGVLAKGAMTYYRIYDANCAGLPEATKNAVEKEIAVKQKHYNLLRKYSPYFEQLYDCYKHGNIQWAEEQEYHYWWNFTRSSNSE